MALLYARRESVVVLSKSSPGKPAFNGQGRVMGMDRSTNSSTIVSVSPLIIVVFVRLSLSGNGHSMHLSTRSIFSTKANRGNVLFTIQ